MTQRVRKFWLLILLVPAVVTPVAIVRAARVGDRVDVRPSARASAPSDLALELEEEARERATKNASEPSPEPEIADGPLAAFGGGKRVKTGALAWTPGKQWRVATWYFSEQNGSGGRWSTKPIEWRFTVEGTETLDGRDVWVVAVDPVDTTGMPYNPGGKIYVAVDDHSIVAVRDRVQERGLVRERYLRYDDPANAAASSLFPVEIPGPGVDARERADVSAVPPADPFRPDPKMEAPKTSGTVIDVEFEADGVTIRQRWDTACPWWPAYSRTSTTVSILKTEP